MVFVVAIVTQWTQFQFSLAAEARYAGDPDRLTRFFGTVNFGLGFVAFVIQLFATGPALRRFGVGATVLLLPIALATGSMLTVIWPGLLFVVVTNAFDQAFRFSIDKATFELLYLPLPTGVKTGVKGVIDLIVNRLGDALGGIMLGIATQGFSLWLVMIPGAGLGLRGLAAITAVLALVWVGIAVALRRGYVQAITDSIHQYRLDVERASAPVLDRSVTAALVGTLESADPEAILFALRAFELQHRGAPHPAVRTLLDHPSGRVRARALALLNAAGDRSVLPRVEPLLRDPDLHVRTEALLYLAYHARIDPLERIQSIGDFPDYSIRAGMVAFLSQPGRLQNLDAARVLLAGMVEEHGAEGQRARHEAATLLARLPNEFGAELATLLADEDEEVVRAALSSLGELRRPDLAGLAITRLQDPDLAEPARDALAGIGPPGLTALAAALADSNEPLAIREAIPAVVAQIGTPAGQRLLVDNLLQHDVRLRLRIIGALNTLHKMHPDIDVDRQAVEMVLMAEIMGHYRSYQILGSLGDAFEDADPVAQALQMSMQQEVERIFRLMSLRWPEFDMHSAYVGLTSPNAAVRANALEFLDNILKPQVRSLVVPLLDAQVATGERVRIANEVLGTSVDTHEQAVSALVASDDPWLRSCGVYAVGLLRLQALEPELDRLAQHADPMLRDMVRTAKARLAGRTGLTDHPPSEDASSWSSQEGMGVG